MSDVQGGTTPPRNPLEQVLGRVRSRNRARDWLRVAAVSVVLLATAWGVSASGAASRTVVSLTFDNDTSSAYNLGYLQALRPHQVHATFYVNSSTVGSSAGFMSWIQIRALAAAGNEIGGKTLDGQQLTTLSAPAKVTEICTDRQNIVDQGLKPFSFAYPGGVADSGIEKQVKACGYSNARGASTQFAGGSTYAESLRPTDWLALRAYAPTGRVTLSRLESVVTQAAAHGGGWVPVVIQSVCSATLDLAAYAQCTSLSGWIDLGDLDTFLKWVQSSGQSNGAPSATSFKTIGAVAASADNSSVPTTTIACNGAPCRSTPYTGTVTVTLSASNLGSGVASTRYTTSGTVPTRSSSTYTGPLVLTHTTTIEYRSWSNAGGVEQAHSTLIQVRAHTLVVSLTFDDAYEDQYLYLRPLLRAHHMNATYYVITADSDGPFRCCMSFAQLRTLQSEGDDIGGHGVNHVMLTDPTVSSTDKVADVCGSRMDLLAHGIVDPVSYAYPFGAFDAAAEAVVASCGYGNAREGGDASLVTTVPGFPWAETLPPRNPYVLRTVDVDAPKAKTLADLETFVNAAAAHGGGWLPLTFHQVCDHAAADYRTCMSSWSAIDDRLMGQFLDWLAAAGQPGGAPAGTVVETVRQAMTS
jgi:peptidoglycan/xylan/chitin deacetylase (PgdA/CDA1 family)